MPVRPQGPSSSGPRIVTSVRWGLTWKLWVGGPYHPLRVRAVLRTRGSVEEYVMDCPEVLDMPAIPTLPNGGLPDLPRRPSDLMDKFPTLAGWLSDMQYPDGKPVGMVMLSIRPRMCLYTAQLRIQDMGGLKLDVEAETVDECLLLLEIALTTNPVPWKRDDYPLGKITKRK